jgi:hypothetical protein
MKAALAGQQPPGPEDLLKVIQEFMSEIQKSELELVFHNWIARVEGCCITMETTSMNKPSMITIPSSSVPIGLWPLFIDPLDIYPAVKTYLNLEIHGNTTRSKNSFGARNLSSQFRWVSN